MGINILMNCKIGHKQGVALWYFVFALLLIQELIIKVNTWYDMSFYFDRLSKIIVVFLIGGLFVTKHDNRRNISVVSFLILCFVLGHGSFNSWELNSSSVQSLKLLNKYLFPLLLFIGFDIYISKNKQVIDRSTYLFYSVLLVNSVLMILGFLFKIEFFRSYPLSERFGYCGILYMVNDVTMLYVLGMSLLFYRVFFLNRKELWILTFVYLCSFLLGTKGIILYNILLFSLGILVYLRLRKTKVLKILGVVLVFLIFLIVSIIPLISYFKVIWQEEGVFYALSSYRTDLLVNSSVSIFNEWSIVNWLFGGVDFYRQKIEMDFVDAFFFFGVIGSSFYFYLIFKCILKFQKAKIVQNALVGIVCIISFFAGHLLWSGLNAIYLVIFAQNINFKTNKE